MTKHESLVLTAYTGYLLAPFDDFHKYVEAMLGRSVSKHEFESPAFCKDLMDRVTPEVKSIAGKTWAKE